MSTARLLENRALPDIDFNVVSQEPFQKASKELLGEHGCYPMVAYGTMKDGEAFRNVCRSHDIPYDDFNEVAKNIEDYAEDPKWKSLIEESKKYVGAVVSVSPHPCAHVLDNKDLREEYGVIRIGDVLCVMVTSGEADEYKLLKNDYLVVSVWKLISETFEAIGKPIMTINELLNSLDDATWDMYSKGLTCTLNQCDGDWATELLMQYKPRTVAELAMFVACIRPSFNSWRDIFIERQPYTTGSKELDEVLSSTNGFILFQENLMQYFDWLGVSPAESIGLIKKISKKKIHQEDFDVLEDRLKTKWIENTGSDNMFSETWSMIQSCISYGFAAPHALAVAIDSLYGAYLKAHYPLEYYTVCLNNYSDSEDKTRKLTTELSEFGIKIMPMVFRHSMDIYSMDKSTNTIYKGTASLKYLNSEVSRQLYDMRNTQFDSFIDFLTVNPCNSRQTEILIKLGYFQEFGKSQKLIEEYDLFNKLYGKKQFAKTKLNYPEQTILKYATATEKMYKFFDMIGFIRELCNEIPDKDIVITSLLAAQQEYCGYMYYTNPDAKNFYYITAINTKYTPRLTIYDLCIGESLDVKISKKDFGKNPVCVGQVIKAIIKQKSKVRKTEDGWEEIPDQFDNWLQTYIIKM